MVEHPFIIFHLVGYVIAGDETVGVGFPFVAPALPRTTPDSFFAGMELILI
jgi:hypothetical protein